MKEFQDLHAFDEDKRIDMIGAKVMEAPVTNSEKPPIIAVAVDDHAKADRYVKKLLEKFPLVRVLDRADGPGGAVFIRLGPPLR